MKTDNMKAKRLMAAFAVLAVAFVALAAVPAAATGSDAADDATPSYEEGIIAAGYISDEVTAKGLLSLLTGKDVKDAAANTMFVMYYTGAGWTSGTAKVNDVENYSSVSVTEGLHLIYFRVAADAADADSNAIKKAWEPTKEYKVAITLNGADEKTKTLESTIVGKTVTLYQDAGSTILDERIVTSTFIKADGSAGTLYSAVLVNGDVVIDLNGHTLKAVTKKAADNRDAKIFLVNAASGDEHNTLTIKNGTFEATGYDQTQAGAVICAAENGKVALDRVTFKTDGSALFPLGNASEVKVEDSVLELTGWMYGIGTNNAYSRDAELNIIINHSIFSYDEDGNDATAVMTNVNNAALTIVDSKITGIRHAVMVRSGTATISSSDLSSDNGSSEDADWGTGANVTPATLFVGNEYKDDAYAGKAFATVSGGSITAITGTAIATTGYHSTGMTEVDLNVGITEATSIVCGTGNNKVSITVSDLKYTATSSANPATSLTVKCGSVDLSGTIYSVTIVDGDATVSGDLTVTSTGKIVVKSGATLTIGSGAKIKVEDADDIIFEAGSTVIGSENIVGADSKPVIPDYPDGTVVYKAGTAYTIYHATTMAGTVQFGVAIGDLTYNGSDRAGRFTNLAVASFDRTFTGISSIGEGTLYYALGDDGNPTADPCRDAGLYKLAVSFTMNGGAAAVQVDVKDLPVEIRKAEAGITVGMTGWNYGSYDADVNGPKTTYDLKGSDSDPGYEFVKYYDADGNEVDFASLIAGTYTGFTAVFKDAKNYADKTVEIAEFTVLKAKMKLDVIEVPDEALAPWGVKVSDFVNDNFNVEYDSTTGTVKLTGEVKYIPDVNNIRPGQAALYPAGESSGYYAFIGIDNQNDFSLACKFDGSTTVLNVDAGDKLAILIYLGTDLKRTTTLTVTPENTSYAIETLTVTYDLDRPTDAGYGEAASDVDAAIGEVAPEKVPADPSDTADKTVWMVWSQSEQEGDVYGVAYLNGVEVYKEKMLNDAGVRLWRFSFSEGAPSYTQSGDVVKALDSDFVKKYPGQYTLQIVNGDDIIAEATVDVYGGYSIAGGFSQSAEDALEGIQDAYRDAEATFERTDVIPNTIWMVYYQYGFTDADRIYAYLKIGDETYTTGYSCVSDNGVRCIYMSFNDELASLVLSAGTYKLGVVAVYGEDEVQIAEQDVTITSLKSEVSFEPATEEELRAFGVKPNQIQLGVTISVSVSTVDSADYAVRITGQVIKVDSFPGITPAMAGYYLAFTMKADGVDLNDATITPAFENYVRDGYTFVVYIGNVLSTEAISMGNIIVDFDGSASLYEGCKYVFSCVVSEAKYQVILMDDFYGEDGVVFTEVSLGKGIVLPNGPDATKDFLGWEFNGILYSAGSFVIVTKDMISDEGTVVFNAVYDGDEPEYGVVIVIDGMTYEGYEHGDVFTLPALTGDYIAWTINGNVLGAQYIVNYRDADEDGVITIQGVEKVSGIQRTEYSMDVIPYIVDRSVMVTIDSEQTGPEYFNMNGQFYYLITYTDVNGRYVEDVVVASKIFAFGDSYQDSIKFDLSNCKADRWVNIQFVVDYGTRSIVLDELSFRNTAPAGVGYGETADEVISAVESAGGPDVSSNTIDRTAYIVFYAEAGTYTAECMGEDGVIYTETFTFDSDGMHAWYFSFKEGEVNPDGTPKDISGYYADDASFLIMLKTDEGRVFSSGVFTITASD